MSKKHAETNTDWVDLRKRKPAKGSRVLVCDDSGYVTIEDVEDCYHENQGCVGYKQLRSFEKVWRDGNGTRLRYWMPLPKVPADIEGDGEGL